MQPNPLIRGSAEREISTQSRRLAAAMLDIPRSFAILLRHIQIEQRLLRGKGVDVFRFLNLVSLIENPAHLTRSTIPRFGKPEADLIQAAAARVAAGEDFFSMHADLAVELTSRGYSEIVTPQRFDRGLWDAIESRDQVSIEDYLARAERTRHPIMWTDEP
jgi:hypothetical protein